MPFLLIMFYLSVAFFKVDLKFRSISFHLFLRSVFVKINGRVNPLNWVDFLEMLPNLVKHLIIWLVYYFIAYLDLSHLVKILPGL